MIKVTLRLIRMARGLTQQEILFRCGFKSPATYFRVRKSTTDDKSGK